MDLNDFLMLYKARTLRRLRARIRKHYPDALQKIMSERTLMGGPGPFFFPLWHSEMSQLQWLCICNPQKLPVYLLGDAEIFADVQRLRKSLVFVLLSLTGVTASKL
ncbi:hypothetical protein TRP8649_01186 [Pelagimonas phthalicica]|uniref:Uncharacterized protein n=1 Tax=Pelagimonas phthalicica TaxID=1037362 RepID=A0A238JA50_9RHOB|nr:hypothetical protein [Pelagimonas phthalicica]TDS94389.1 hypothetical protein CLV87_0886 [Pelagimonas phthalicica]SMX27084.1 hypothetical protein TRP8649_01186 [Pelagimonas phthalicica]